MKLDFSKLERIAYQGFDTEAGRRARDKFVEKGYVILEGSEMPFDGLQEERVPNVHAASENGLESILGPFNGIPEGKVYTAVYQAVYDYHKRHCPAGSSQEYWQRAAEDLARVAADFGNDPFVVDLLNGVYQELERS